MARGTSGRGGRGGYAARPSQDDPLVVIPNPIYARIVIASQERNIEPGMWVENALREALKAHGHDMEDSAWQAYCLECETRNVSYGQRWEWDRGRKPRITDPK